MKLNKFLSKEASVVLCLGLALLTGCSVNVDGTNQAFGGPAFTCTPTTQANTLPATTPTGNNVMTVTVNGSLCTLGTSSEYQNEPCVSVTICSPGTATCQTIGNILLDTGSYGLRVFSSLITVPLTAVTTSHGSLAECVQFGDGSSEWGQVMTADVKLGGETASSVPIQLVNSTYATAPGPCSSSQSTPDTSPQQAGFNGILGVGLLNQDCGTFCVQSASNSQYYSCSGTTCTGTTAALASQVSNPVSSLPVDNNGIILELPSVGATGAASVTGSLVLGIGTETNNIPSGVKAYGADANATFSTGFDVNTNPPLTSFIDSGSNFYYLPPLASGLLQDCGGNASGIFCPAATVSLTALNASSTSNATSCVGFQIANATVLNTGNMVFNNVGGDSGGTYFDWGLPFFLGRSVYVGIEGAKSSLATGPYWAY